MSVGEKRRNIDVGSKREKQIVGEKRSERKKKNVRKRDNALKQAV